MKYEKFRELMEEFVADNCFADGCRECHEVGHTITFDVERDEALKKLFEEMI